MNFTTLLSYLKIASTLVTASQTFLHALPFLPPQVAPVLVIAAILIDDGAYVVAHLQTALGGK